VAKGGQQKQKLYFQEIRRRVLWLVNLG
jgi:hypothetical protein